MSVVGGMGSRSGGVVNRSGGMGSRSGGVGGSRSGGVGGGRSTFIDRRSRSGGTWRGVLTLDNLKAILWKHTMSHVVFDTLESSTKVILKLLTTTRL
jgi:hypothetical protein